MTRRSTNFCTARPCSGALRVTAPCNTFATLLCALQPAPINRAASYAAGRSRRGSSAAERALYKGEAGGASPSPVSNFQQGRATEARQPHKLKVAGSTPAPVPNFGNPAWFKEAASIGVLIITILSGIHGGIAQFCEPVGLQRPPLLRFSGQRFAAGWRTPQGPAPLNHDGPTAGALLSRSVVFANHTNHLKDSVVSLRGLEAAPECESFSRSPKRETRRVSRLWRPQPVRQACGEHEPGGNNGAPLPTRCPSWSQLFCQCAPTARRARSIPYRPTTGIDL